MELPRALRELQEARDASRSLQCFGQIASIARDLPSSQDLFPLSVRFEIDPHLGVKLLGEMKRALGKSANNKRQLWKVFGQLLFWGFELHRLGHGRANDVQFETQLNLVLEFAWGESELLLPHHLDTFFAKAIAQSRTTGSRLGEAVDSCLERFLSKPTSSLELQFDPFCRSVVLRAPRTSLLPVLRCVAGRVYTQSLEPVLVRLLSFLLGTLDFTGEGGELEHQAAAECIRGDFNLVRVASEALLQSRGTTALEEETGLVQLVSKLFVCVAPKWQLLLERTSNAVAIEYASCMELVLTKLCKAKRQAEPALVSSLTRAVAVILATASPLASSAGTTIQTFKQQADEENQLLLCALRVNFALCFHTDSPQSELFGLPLHNGKLGCSAALVYLLLLALGFEPNTNAATGAMEGHFEQFLFQRLKRVLGESETLVLWSAGEFALQMHSGAFPAAESWHFSFTLAARRVRDLQRPKTAAQDKLELLFRAFHGLQEVRSSIRHLQDLGWFYIAFGKRQGFSIAAERFLGDVAKTLFDLKRYWECGNVYVMLGTCDLACKRYTGSSHHFALASDAFDKLGLHRESHKVRLASRVFAKQSLFPREWDWCLTNGHGDNGAASFAHYFLVGAVGLGDADLTVVRIVLSSWHLYELAFDEAVRYLESGSYRRCIAGQLRWDAGGVAKFFPSEVVGQDEFGFWIQRVWPGMGEEDAVEHCCGKWGVVGEPSLVIQVKDQRRGLNALISACSVLVDVAPLPGLELDVPVDWDTGDIPLPLQPPPPASANHSYFPSNESVSFHDSAVAGNVSFLPDDSFGEEEIRPPGSPPPSELDIAPPSSPPPPQSSSLLSAITPPDAVSEAEQRKREFRRRREQENLLLQQQQEEAARMQREEALKQERKEEKRLRKEQEALQQEEEAAKRARSEAKRKQLVEQAAAAEALQRQQDEILRQQEDAERLRAEHRLRQQQQREAEEQFALKQQLEAQYFAEQQSRLQEQQSRLLQEQQSRLFQEQQSQEQIQLEVEQEHQRLQEQKRMLKQRQQQQQSFNTTFEALPTAADTSNPMLIFKRKQQLQSPPQHSFEQQSTTPPKSSGSFSRRVVLLPTANNNNTSTNLEDVLQRSSPPKNLFNVNGAKISLEEWEQLERFKAKGEGWLGATVLSKGQVSLRFTKGPTVEVYLEPKFELLCTLAQVRQVVRKEGSNMLEMRAGGGDSLLLVCAQEEMLRALISTFN